MKTGALIATVLLIPHLAFTGEVRLAWDPNTEPELVGYRLCYGKVPGQYGTVLDVGNVTAYTVKDLAPGTYYFAVKAYGHGLESAYSNEVTATVSKDSDKDLPVADGGDADKSGSGSSGDNIPADSAPPPKPDGSYEFALPRFSAGQNVPGEETMVGLAFVNRGSQPAAIQLTAMDDSGQPMAGRSIINPVGLNLASNHQLAMIDWEIFGSGFPDSRANGWIRIESNDADVTGFFLIFDEDLRFMDGAAFESAGSTAFVFTQIQPDGCNRILIINTNSAIATADFYLVGADGTIRNTQRRAIASRGILTEDLFSGLFAGIEPQASDYILARTDRAVHPFQVMRQKSGDIAALAAQNAASGATMLYAPQYVLGGAYQTSLSVINLEDRAGTVSIRLIGEDGVQMGSARTLSIPAKGKLLIDDQRFFLATTPGTMTAGYVEIGSDGVQITGSVLFGDRNGETFIAALPLISSLRTATHFGHIASDDTYFTGLAIINPNPADTTVSVEVRAANGSLLYGKDVLIQAKHRKSGLLTQFFPTLEGKNQTSGYIAITATQPIAAYALFGTHSLSVLAAIPH